MGTALSATESLCPVCFSKVDAIMRAHEDGIYMEKNCPSHGSFETLVWHGTPEEYKGWIDSAGVPGRFSPSGPHLSSAPGCPFCCGLCEDHESETFTAALMVTSRCNLNCPVCFTKGTQEKRDPSLIELKTRLSFYLETSGSPFPLELCGGEPTVRDDLCQIAQAARDMGFSHIQLNTNGIRIAQDPDYAKQLRESGITTAYLGFDGTSDKPYLATCGAPLLEAKVQAIENLAAANVGIVLVPVLSNAVNMGEIGAIVKFAKEHMPFVRGINFQPLGRLGKVPSTLLEKDRITLPDVLRALEQQTNGEVCAHDFMPGGVEHALCSFQALYMRKADGTLHPLSKRKVRESNDCAARHVRETVPLQWHASPMPILTIGGMLFQDAYNVDLSRLKRCPTHIIGDNLLYPLCAKYLTSQEGRRLYEGIA